MGSFYRSVLSAVAVATEVDNEKLWRRNSAATQQQVNMTHMLPGRAPLSWAAGLALRSTSYKLQMQSFPPQTQLIVI